MYASFQVTARAHCRLRCQPEDSLNLTQYCPRSLARAPVQFTVVLSGTARHLRAGCEGAMSGSI